MAAAANDNVPPAADLLQVYVLKSKVPVVTDRSPATAVFTPKVVDVVLLMVKLLKVVDVPPMVWVAPLKFTVPLLWVNVPELE